MSDLDTKGRHNSVASDMFAKVVKATNHIWLQDANLVWFASGLEHDLKIHTFRPIWPCQIVKVLATEVNFFHPSGFWTIINCILTFCTKMLFVASVALWSSLNSNSISSQIRLHCTFICSAFRSHTAKNDAQHVSTPTTTILWVPSTAFTALVTWYTHCKLA